MRGDSSVIDNYIRKGRAVVKSNALIRGSYNLSTNEQKIIYALAAQIRPEDSDFKEYTFSIKDFYNLLGSTSHNKHKVLKETIEKLASTSFTFKEGKDTVTVAWLSGARYHEGKGLVTLTFHQWLRPYLLQLKSYFTTLNPNCVYHLSGKHSIRLFEYLKSYSFLNEDIYIGLDNLKEVLCVQDKYSQFRDFNTYILKKAQKEFVEKADIIFSYTSVKENKKVIGIEFHIETNPNFKHDANSSIANISAIKDAPCSQDMCLVRMKEFGIPEKVGKELLAIRSGTSINLILNRVQAEAEAGKIRDVTAFSITAIRDGYYTEEIEKAEKKKKSFAEFNPNPDPIKGIPEIIKDQVNKIKKS